MSRPPAISRATVVESFVDHDASGHVADAKQGASLILRAFNNGDVDHSVAGQLEITDAFGNIVTALKPTLPVQAHASASRTFNNVARGRLGAFRARWKPEQGSGLIEPEPETKDGVATLTTTRLAVIESMTELSPWHAPFGFNHAYPWDFLVTSAQRAGVLWWRDWSAKWDTVEHKQGMFDWRTPDAQIGRVADLGGNVEILLPFPAAAWSTSARPKVVAKAAGRDSYLQSRLPVAFAPSDLNDFARYAAETVRHYRQFRTTFLRTARCSPFTFRSLTSPCTPTTHCPGSSAIQSTTT